MNEHQLPALPSGQDQDERARQERIEEVRQYLLDARENYPEPYYMLEYKGVPFSTMGGIQAISGQKKNGKTFVLAQLMAAILGTGSARVNQYLPGLKVPERTREWLGHEPTVLYVDTEMEKLNSAKVLRRVHWLCGWDMDVPNPRFNVLWLREITDVKNETGEVKERAYERRYRLILTAIEYLSPDAVFIDGIRDIIGDFNDNKESATLVGELMALANQRQICIWNALHMNPRPGNDDESKMRGHLGTELGNKITDTFVSFKKKDGNGQVTFTVKQNDARGKDMEDWQFTVTDDAGALGIPRISNALQTMLDSIADEELQMEHETVRVLKGIITPPRSEFFTSILGHLKKELHVGEKNAKKYFNALREHCPGLIYQRKDGRLTIDMTELAAYEDGLPFANISEP